MSSSKRQRVKDEDSSDQVTDLEALRHREPQHFILKVVSFSVLSKSSMYKYESDEFEAGGYKWRLVLYPKGDNNRNGSNHISLYLSLSDTKTLPRGWEVEANFNLFVYNNISQKYLIRKVESAMRFHWLKTEWGFAQFLPLDYFKETSNGYLFDDTCVFGVEVFVTSSSASAKRQTLSMTNITRNKIFSWTISQFSKKDGILYSDKFEIGGVQWKLRLYPKGFAEFKDKSVSLFLLVPADELTKLAANWKAYAEFKLRIRNQVNGNHVEKTGSRWFNNSSVGRGYDDFIPLSDVNDKSKGFMRRDTIIVEAEITIVAI